MFAICVQECNYCGSLLLLDLCAGQYGKWSTDSCRVVSDDGATTQCVCTQLGHFGLLFVSKVCNSVPCRLCSNYLPSIQPLLWLDLCELHVTI